MFEAVALGISIVSVIPRFSSSNLKNIAFRESHINLIMLKTPVIGTMLILAEAFITGPRHTECSNLTEAR